VRSFTRLFVASAVSNVGDGMLLAALPLLARRLSEEPLTVSAVTAAATAPWLVFGLLAGAVVDRVDRARLMVRADVARALLAAGFAGLVALDRASIGAAIVAVATLGVAETLFDTAAQSFVPAVVDADELEHANGRLFAAQLAGNGFVGPPIGAALFGIAAAAPVAVDAVSFALSAAVLPRVGRSPVTARTSTSLVRDVRDGLTWLWSDVGVRAFAIGAAVINLAHPGVLAVTVLFVRDELGASESSYGLVLAGIAVGGLIGTQLTAPLVGRIGRDRAVRFAIGTFVVALVVAGTAVHVVVATAALAVFGAAGEVWNVVAVSYRQARVPDHLLGRVMASYRVIAYGAMPTGALLGGAVAPAFGLRAPFLVGAALVAALLLYFARR
jgi:MFS family permease